MNSAYADAFALELASLDREVAVPTGALAYGRDLSCTVELDPALAEVDPASPVAIVEAIVRRYITPRGALIDDAFYGQDTRALLNRGVTLEDLRAISGALTGEAQKDDRVALANVGVTADLRSSRMRIAATITPEDPAQREFSFVVAVEDGSTLEVTINGK